jgi:hypothetical protein
MDIKIKRNKMANTKQQTTPSAWVVNSSDRGRKSIKKGKVYLSDKSEFEIELFNPLKDCVLADIKLNGKSISKNGLILKPGQRFYLDCFIDDKKKFVFNTYDVDDTDEVKSAIEKNGLLEVFFYKESVLNLDQLNRTGTIHIHNHNDYFYPWGRTYYYGNGTTYGGVTNTTLCGSNTITSNANLGSYTTNCVNTNVNYSTGINTVFTSSCDSNMMNISSAGGGAAPKSIETGRIEKGEASDQKFKSVDMDFETYYIASTVIQLLPDSRKPIEASDLKKNKETEELVNIVEVLEKLSEIHKKGILTDDEFNEKKKELLSRI